VTEIGSEEGSVITESSEPGPAFDTSVPHIARVYDYWLGGKDNFAADRKAGDWAREAYPQIALGVRANRAFLARMVRYLAGEAGIRQFLDIGTGIPSANNTHQVAQSVAPQARIVYTDNDPVVLSHARALMASGPQGSCDYIDADLRDTDRILQQAAKTLDFGQPVAIMLIAVLHCIPDSDDPHAIVRRLLAAVPAGSYVALSHPGRDLGGANQGEMYRRLNELMPAQVRSRTFEEVSGFFDGTELVAPGVVKITEWRPESELEAKSPGAMWGGAGLKTA